MNNKLQKFHIWLTKNCPTYLSMVANGSNATGDALIKGRSDQDILLIFSRWPFEDLDKIGNYLKKSSFSDEYYFIPFCKDNFLRCHNSSHDFSRKFRTKTLFGPDFVSKVKLPNKKQTFVLYSRGLNDLASGLERRLLNANFWSERNVRNVFWKIFKEAFMNLQIKFYYETGKYPRTRKELVEKSKSPILANALSVFNEINTAKKKDVVKAGEKLLQYLGSL